MSSDTALYFGEPEKRAGAFAPMPEQPIANNGGFAPLSQSDLGYSDREMAIVNRHIAGAGSGDTAYFFGLAKADEEVNARRAQRAYVEKQAPSEIVNTTRDLLLSTGDRSKQLDIYRKLTPEQRQGVLMAAPGVAQQLGDDRGGLGSRFLDAVARGTAAVSQPIMELTGLGGTAEEIDYLHKLNSATQEFSPAREGDPMYQSAPLQAVEMMPWMATVVGGNVLGSAAGKGAGMLLGRAAAIGVPGAKTAFQAAGAAGRLPSAVGLKASTTKGVFEGVGGAVGGTIANFPGAYAQEVDQLKEIGMEDGQKLRMLAAGTAVVNGLIESGIVGNPFAVGQVPLREGALKAARQYLWEAAKNAPGEFGEEYVQGVASGLGQHVAQYLDENAKEKTISEAFKKGWDQMVEAGPVLGLMLGVPAVGGASAAAIRARRIQLENIRSKGFVSEDDAKDAGVAGANRRERMANVESEIKRLSAAEDEQARLDAESDRQFAEQQAAGVQVDESGEIVPQTSAIDMDREFAARMAAQGGGVVTSNTVSPQPAAPAVDPFSGEQQTTQQPDVVPPVSNGQPNPSLLTPEQQVESDRKFAEQKAAEQQSSQVESPEVPVVSSPEQHAALPMYGVYEAPFRGERKFFVKEFENRGAGDALFDSLEEANKYSLQAARRNQERVDREQKAKADDELAAKKQRDYEASFGVFLSTDPKTKGRQLKVLGSSRRFEGKVVTIKDLVEQKVAGGAVVNASGQLESPDGRYLGSDKITKIGIDYARHLISEAKAKSAIQGKKGIEESKVVAPAKTKRVFAVMTSDGVVHSDPNAKMHYDVIESLGLDPNDIIDGGFIEDGKYRMSMSDGGYAATEGEPEQVIQVRKFAEAYNAEMRDQPETKPTERNMPSYRDWRFKSTARNSGKIVPNKVGAKFLPDQMQSIVEWAKSEGYSVSNVTPTGISVSDQKTLDRLDIAMYGAEGVKAEASKAASEKRKEESKKADEERKAKADSRESADWITSTFGDVINDANRIALSDYVEGVTDKFSGIVSANWKDGLEKLDALSTEGKIDWKKVKDAYNAKAEQQPSPQEQEQDKTRKGVIRKAIEDNGGYENNSADDVESIRRKLYNGEDTPTGTEIRSVMDEMKVEAGRNLESERKAPESEQQPVMQGKTEGFRLLPEKSRSKFEDLWNAKDASIKDALDMTNKAWRAEFEARTGLALPKTKKGTAEVVEKWHSEGRKLANQAIAPSTTQEKRYPSALKRYPEKVKDELTGRMVDLPPIYLTGKSTPETREEAKKTRNLGVLVTPATAQYRNHLADYEFFGVDNGAFSGKFNEQAFYKLLGNIRKLGFADKALFAAAPDVVGDWKATLERSEPHLDRIRDAGFPVAIVLQNGATVDTIPWSKIDVLFVGGDDAFKTGTLPGNPDRIDPNAEMTPIIRAARMRGMPIHYGRVNSAKRLENVHFGGYGNSVDGTFLKFGNAADQLDRIKAWLKPWGEFPALPGQKPKVETNENVAVRSEPAAPSNLLDDLESIEELRAVLENWSADDKRPKSSYSTNELIDLAKSRLEDFDLDSGNELAEDLAGQNGEDARKYAIKQKRQIKDWITKAESESTLGELEGNREFSESFIKIVADDVSKIRKQDVYRLLSEVPSERAGYFENWLIKRRPDLAEEINNVSSDLLAERSQQAEKSETQPEGEMSIEDFVKAFVGTKQVPLQRTAEAAPGAVQVAQEIEYSDIRKHEPGIVRTIRAEMGGKSLLLEQEKNRFNWSIRELDSKDDIVFGIIDLKRAKAIAGRIFLGTFDKDADLRFSLKDASSLAYSNQRLAGLWSITTAENLAATLNATGYYTDGRVLLKVSEKDRDAILKKAGTSGSGRVININSVVAPSKDLSGYSDNEMSVVGYRGGDTSERTVMLKNKAGHYVILNKAYHDTVVKRHPSAKIWGSASKGSNITSAVLYEVDGDVVGLVMPMAVSKTDKYLDAMIRGEFETAEEPSPAISSKTRKSLKKEPKQGVKEGMDKAKDGAKMFIEGIREAAKGNTPFANIPMNEKIARGLGMMADGLIEAGKYKFADFIDSVVELVGLQNTKSYAKYLEAGWSDKAKHDSRLDNAQSVLGLLDKKTVGDAASVSAQAKIARKVVSALENGEALTSQSFFAIADEAFGGTRANNDYGDSEATDALELGVNMYLQGKTTANASPDRAKETIDEIKQVMQLVPRHRGRTGNKEIMQQFSTPPAYAYVVNWIANVTSDDVVLEPSAGMGGLAIHAANSGATVYANELDKERAKGLQELPIEKVFMEDAEQVGAILAGKIKGLNVVIMNPPFSRAGKRMGDKMVQGTDRKHIDEALLLLPEGGRLVAIVGAGLHGQGQKMTQWLDNLPYKLTANIEVARDVYRGYGTEFPTRVLVIDKVDRTGTKAITGMAGDLGQLIDIATEVRNARPSANVESAPDQQDGEGGDRQNEIGSKPSDGLRDTTAAGVSQQEEQGSEDKQPASDRGDGDADARSGARSAGGNTGGRRGGRVGRGSSGKPVRAGEKGRAGAAPAGKPDDARRAGLTKFTARGRIKDTTKKGDITESTFEVYVPSISVEGARPHPAPIVESAAMAAVDAPSIEYEVDLMPGVFSGYVNEDGLYVGVSDIQLEAIALAGAAHEKLLASGERRGFLIGDGTGVGKAREALGIIMDDLIKRGVGKRRKAVFITKNDGLVKDAVNEWVGVGGDASELHQLSGVASGESVDIASGILTVSYDTLKGEASSQARSAGKNLSRVDQIVNWVGDDFDGVVVFDEAHLMANSLDSGQGTALQKASQRALAGVDLQKRLPNARFVYLSATAATEVRNLAYAERLGLWGPGTEFASKNDFINEIEAGGVAAMEKVAADMKAMGMYIARNLSYDDGTETGKVEFDRITHSLTDDQRRIYDKLSEAWLKVLKNIDAALDLTENKKGKSRIVSAFWSSNQRFWNDVIASMMAPTLLKNIEKDLKDGKSVVLQLYTTKEAATNRAIAGMLEGQTYDEIDASPRRALMEFVEKSFPVQRHEEYLDENGNVRTRPVVDSEGKAVNDPQAVEMKEKLLDEIGSLDVASRGPIDMILDHFGRDSVAEVSGRSQRLVRNAEGSLELEKRSKASSRADREAFMEGRKRILVFSEAGGTGASYHASLSSKNQQRRSHYLWQPGWSATTAVQGLGRAHRSNQASAPQLHLLEPNLEGYKRFISTVARRLAQLGALTKGQRTAADAGLFSPSDNLESTESSRALSQFLDAAISGQVEGIDKDFIVERLGFDQFAGLTTDTRSVQIPQFLNRILNLPIAEQNKVFKAFMEKFDAIVAEAVASGTLDQGMETLKALRVVKDSEIVVNEHSSGAKTKLVELTVTKAQVVVSFDEMMSQRDRYGSYKPEGFVISKTSGKIFAVMDQLRVSQDAKGRTIHDAMLIGVNGNSYGQSLEQLESKQYWEKVTDIEKVRMEWDKQFSASPKTVDVKWRLLTGALLPVWKKIVGSERRVWRTKTEDGEMILGRHLSEETLSRTLENLGVDEGDRGTPKNIPSKTAMQAIYDGHAVLLVNGWQIKKRTIDGQDNIEISGPDYSSSQAISNAGGFSRRIDYATRFFIPFEDTEGLVLDRISNISPVKKIIYKTSAGDAKRSLDNGLRRPPDVLYQADPDVDSTIRSKAIDLGIAAKNLGVERFEDFIAYSVKTIGELETRRIGGYLTLVGQSAGMSGVRPARDVLGVPVTLEQYVQLAKETFVSVPAEQVEAGIDAAMLVLPQAAVGFAPAGSPVPGQGLLMQEEDVRRIDMNYKDVTRRVPQLTEAAKQLKEGKITKDEYANIVDRYKEVTPYSFVPEPATAEDAKRALSDSKFEAYGDAATSIPDGYVVELRLDIPAYKDHGVWINSIHRKVNGKSVTQYDSYSYVTGADFIQSQSKQEMALEVATGAQTKSPFARIKGKWKPTTKEQAVATARDALQSSDWTQVGYDPERHGYFYDRSNHRMVLESADEVIQIGPLVLAKNPVYSKESVLFQQQAQGGNVKGWTQFISGTRALIGATSKADISTVIHEFAHPMRRFLLDKSVPQSKRADITDEEISMLEEKCGVDPKTGVWEVENEERFAKMWEQYWFEGKSPNAVLDSLFEKISRWMQGVYESIKQITGSDKPLDPKVQELFDKLVQRGLTAEQRAASKKSGSGDTAIPASTITQDEPWRQRVTSIKNEVVQLIRMRLGVPGLTDPSSETFEQWLNEAGQLLSNDPAYADRLVRELAQSNRNVDNIDVAVMQIHFRHLNNQLEYASERLFKAKEENDSVAAAKARLDTDLLVNQIEEFTDITKRTGTEAGRALVARRIALQSDFTQAALIRKARIANAGEELSEKQIDEITELSRRIAAIEGELEKEKQKNNDLERKIAAEQSIEDAKKESGKPVRNTSKSRASDGAKKFVGMFASVFGKRGDTGTLQQTEDEKMAEAAVELIKGYVDDGVYFFGNLMANFKRDIGMEVPISARVAIRKAWDEMKSQGDIPTPETQERDSAELRSLARTIQRDIVESGIEKPDEVIDAVHESLQEIVPELTRRETMDAMSGYGQFYPASKDPTDRIIRDLNSQYQQMAKLDDMRKGLAPKRTGSERPEPSPEVRDLIRQVNEMKRNSEYFVTDPETQLKTIFQATRTALRNRIYDLDRALKITREPIPGREPKLFSGQEAVEIEDLRKRRDELMAEYKRTFPKPGATFEQRAAMAERAIDRAIAEIEKQLASGDVSQKRQTKTISTPSIDAKRNRLSALRAERDAVREMQNPKMTKEERDEKAYIANLLNRIADYEDRKARGYFGPRPKKEPRDLSEKELILKKQLDDLKDEFFRLAAEYRSRNMTPAQKAWDYTKETMHLARAIMTSLDFSAVFRQGGIASFSHPVLAAKSSVKMLNAALTSKSEFDTMEKIQADDDYALAMRANLAITTDSEKITRQEEAYMGRWAKWGIGKKGTKINTLTQGLLIPVSASARAYTTFLNSMRFQLFKYMVSNLGANGQVTIDEAKVIATYINVATGRADLGSWNQAMANLNMVFFAPRYVTSRFQYLAMPFYILPSTKVSGRVKKMIAMEYARHALGLASFLGLSVALGSLLTDDEEEKPTVELDPRSSDWMKLRIGETRIDPMAGLSQSVALIGQIATGQKKQITGGMKALYGKDRKFGDPDLWDVFTDFGRKKLAPVPGAMIDLMVGENVIGEKETPLSVATGLFIPLSGKEVLETMNARGFLGGGPLISVLSLLGMGGGTYGPRTAYASGDAAKREELFNKALDQVKWDSPDLPYKDFLTAGQVDKFNKRREAKKQSLVYAASASPKRKDYRSDESFADSVEEQKKAMEAVVKSGMGYEEVRQLLLGYYKRNYGSAYEMRGGAYVMKESLATRLRQIKRQFSGK